MLITAISLTHLPTYLRRERREGERRERREREGRAKERKRT